MLLCLAPLFTVGQEFHRGVIMPLVDSLQYAEKYCCILAPEKGFSVYDRPNGNLVGTLKRQVNKQDDQAVYKIFLVTGSKKMKVDQYLEIEYDLYAINYTDSVDGFIKVLDTLKSCWINVAELKQKGFRAVNWRSFMMSLGEKDAGFYANEPGLRLRKEPNTNSEVIGSVRGDLFEIKLTAEISGQWNKVKIIKYKQSPCETELSNEENIEYRSEGWLKIIDDRGEPNLWRHTRGC